MLREPQHERNFRNHFKASSVRPELVEGFLGSFSAAYYIEIEQDWSFASLLLASPVITGR